MKFVKNTEIALGNKEMSTNKLSTSEVAMIKGIMKYHSNMQNQEILAKFSIPSRTINSGRISEIRNKHPKHVNIPDYEKNIVDDFLNNRITLLDLMNNGYLPGMGSSATTKKEKIFGNIVVDMDKLIVLGHESVSLEFKEFYEQESIPTYAKILSGMVNAGVSGSIIFGVNDNHDIVGVGSRKGIVISKIERLIKEHFEPYIVTELHSVHVIKKRLFQLKIKNISSYGLVICKKTKTVRERNHDKTILEDGAIYYRYGSETDKVRHAELSMIIRKMSSN